MITFWPSKMITFRVLSFILSFGVIIYFMLSFNVIIFDVIIWCYHLVLLFGAIIYLMLSFAVIISHSLQICVIIFPCTAWVMLSFNVIIFCIPPFFFFLKTWHTQHQGKLLRRLCLLMLCGISIEWILLTLFLAARAGKKLSYHLKSHCKVVLTY